MSERVSSIPARWRVLPGRFLAPFPLLALALFATPAEAQVGPGEWAPDVELGVALPSLREADAPAVVAGFGLTSHLLAGPAWQARIAVTEQRSEAPLAAASVAVITAFDALSFVPYAGLSAGTRYAGDFAPTVGLLLGLDRRTARDHATGLVLRLDAALPIASESEPTWSGALLFNYRWIVDSLATPEL